jgi:hypothetical protein
MSSDIWQEVVKIGKDTEGVTNGCFDVKYDYKKIKKAVYTTTKKKNKKKKIKKSLHGINKAVVDE